MQVPYDQCSRYSFEQMGVFLVRVLVPVSCRNLCLHFSLKQVIVHRQRNDWYCASQKVCPSSLMSLFPHLVPFAQGMEEGTCCLWWMSCRLVTFACNFQKHAIFNYRVSREEGTNVILLPSPCCVFIWHELFIFPFYFSADSDKRKGKYQYHSTLWAPELKRQSVDKS